MWEWRQGEAAEGMIWARVVVGRGRWMHVIGFTTSVGRSGGTGGVAQGVCG